MGNIPSKSTVRKNYDNYREEWALLYRQGVSIREIARRYNINKESVALQVKKTETIRKTIITRQQKQRAYKLYLDGESKRSIARTLNISLYMVSKILLKEFNILPDENRQKYAHLKNEFIEQYNSGLSLTNIEEKHGVSRQCILNYISEKTNARTYEMASRNYNHNEEYFDKLNNINSSYLGAVFAKGYIYKINTSEFLNVSLTRFSKDIIYELFSNLTNNENAITQPNENLHHYGRINSSYLCKRIKQLGLNKSLPLNEKGLNVNRFFDTFFSCAVSITDRYVSISLNNCYIDDTVKQLKLPTVRVIKGIKKANIIIENKKYVEQIMRTYPQLYSIFRKYSFENNSKRWKSVIRKIEN